MQLISIISLSNQKQLINLRKSDINVTYWYHESPKLEATNRV